MGADLAHTGITPRPLSTATNWKRPRPECRAYSYNNFSRVIAALRDGQWVPIGKAYNAFGDFELYEGKDQVP